MRRASWLLQRDYPDDYARLKWLADVAEFPVDSALNLGYQFGLQHPLSARPSVLRRLRAWLLTHIQRVLAEKEGHEEPRLGAYLRLLQLSSR